LVGLLISRPLVERFVDRTSIGLSLKKSFSRSGRGEESEKEQQCCGEKEESDGGGSRATHGGRKREPEFRDFERDR